MNHYKTFRTTMKSILFKYESLELYLKADSITVIFLGIYKTFEWMSLYLLCLVN